MSFLKKHIEISIIAFLGLILRLIISGIHSYSNDELSAINRLSYDNFSDLIEFGVMKGDMHPAGVQVFMKLWSNLGGLNEFGMRLPFVLMGVGSIFLIYKIGLDYASKRAGLIAAIFLAFLYFPIMNSEFARPYSPGLFFSLLSAFYAMKVLFKGELKWKHALFLGLTFAGAMYSHYFAFLFAGWMGFSCLVFARKERLKYVVAAGIFALLLYLPHFTVTSYHLGVGGLQWLAPPDSDWIFQFLAHVLNNSLLLIVLVISSILMAWVFRTEKYRFNRFDYFWMVLFFGIYIVGFIFSYISTPVLKYPVMLFPLPFLFLLIGRLIGSSVISQPISVLLVIVFIGSTVFERDLFGNRHYELFKEPAELITSWDKQYGEENIFKVYNLNNPNYMNFYAEQWGEPIRFDWDVLEFGDAAKLREDLKVAEQEYLVVGYSARLTLPQVFETCLEFYPNIISGEKYNNAAVYLLSKKTSTEKQFYSEELIADFNANSQRNSWQLDGKHLRQIHDEESGLMKEGYLLEEPTIFGPEYHFRLADIPQWKKQYLKVEVEAHIDSTQQLTASFSVRRDGEPLQHRGENYWEGRDLEQMLTDGNEAYFVFRIPDFIDYSDDLIISLWNRNGTQAVLIEEIRVYAVDNIWN